MQIWGNQDSTDGFIIHYPSYPQQMAQSQKKESASTFQIWICVPKVKFTLPMKRKTVTASSEAFPPQPVYGKWMETLGNRNQPAGTVQIPPGPWIQQSWKPEHHPLITARAGSAGAGDEIQSWLHNNGVCSSRHNNELRLQWKCINSPLFIFFFFNFVFVNFCWLGSHSCADFQVP